MKDLLDEISLMINSKMATHQGNMNRFYDWMKKFPDDEWVIETYYLSIEREMTILLYWYGMKDLYQDGFELKGVL